MYRVGSEFEINIVYFLKEKYSNYFDSFNFIQFIDKNSKGKEFGVVNDKFSHSRTGSEMSIHGMNGKLDEYSSKESYYVEKRDQLINDIKFQMQIQSSLGIIDYIGNNNIDYSDENDYNLDFLVNPELYDIDDTVNPNEHSARLTNNSSVNAANSRPSITTLVYSNKTNANNNESVNAAHMYKYESNETYPIETNQNESNNNAIDNDSDAMATNLHAQDFYNYSYNLHQSSLNKNLPFEPMESNIDDNFNNHNNTTTNTNTHNSSNININIDFYENTEVVKN